MLWSSYPQEARHFQRENAALWLDVGNMLSLSLDAVLSGKRNQLCLLQGGGAAGTQVSLPGQVCAILVSVLVLEGWSSQLSPQHSVLNQVLSADNSPHPPALGL